MNSNRNYTDEQFAILQVNIDDRLAWIAKREAEAAYVGGIGAHGEFEPERDRLIEESERLLHVQRQCAQQV